MRRMLAVATAVALALVMMAPGASATVHEITGMWCSDGHAAFDPPGITGRSNAGNFARPLIATGFVGDPVPHDDGVNGPGLLFSFDFDHPASKLVSNGQIWFVGDGTYLTGFELDLEHGFANCFR